MGQQAIAKTVEVSTAAEFVVNSTGTDQTVNPSQNLFPNVFALAADIDDQSSTLSFSVEWIESDGGVSPLTFTPNRFIVICSTELVDITGAIATKLGFDGTETVREIVGGSLWAIAATNAPEDIWLPQSTTASGTIIPMHTSDQNWFNENPNELFKGTKGTDGNLSGIAYSGRKMRVADWPWIDATNAIPKANSATTIQSVRSFSYVVNSARQMVLDYSTSGNKYCKGVYYVENTDTYGINNSGLPTSWDSGDVNENYVFCSAGPPQVQGASSDITRRYYDVSLELTTAVAPAWGWDIS